MAYDFNEIKKKKKKKKEEENMGRSILLLFEHIAFGGDIALEWKILWDGHIASVQGSAWKGSIASWRSLVF